MTALIIQAPADNKPVAAWQRQLEQRDGIQNDKEAIEYYLKIRCKSPNTQRGFIRDCRKLQWYIEHHGNGEITHFADLGLKSCAKFFDWLQNPTEGDLSHKSEPYKIDDEINPQWRPLTKSLTPASANATRSNLMAFWDFMVNTQYLIANPFKALKPLTDPDKKLRHRELPMPAIRAVIAHLNSRSSEGLRKQKQRVIALERWLFWLFIITGSRVTALSNATTEHFILKGDGTRWLRLHTKGGKIHEVFWPEIMDIEYKRFLTAMNEPATNHLVLSARSTTGHQPMTANGIWRRIKELFGDAATTIERGETFTPAQQQMVDILKAVSPHWIRHGLVSVLVNHTDNSIYTAQAIAGHSSFTTTEGYQTTEQDQINKAITDLVRLLN